MQTRATYRWFGIARIIVGIATSTLWGPTSIQVSNRSLIGLVKKGNVPGKPRGPVSIWTPNIDPPFHQRTTTNHPAIPLPRCKVKAMEGTATRDAKAAETVNWAASAGDGEQSNHQNGDDLGMLYEIGWIPHAHMCYISVYMCHSFMYSNTLYNLN